MMFVMLLWVYIHTGQAWKICLATVRIETTIRTTVGIETTIGLCSKGRIGSIPAVARHFVKLARCEYTLRVTSQI